MVSSGVAKVRGALVRDFVDSRLELVDLLREDHPCHLRILV